MHKQCIPYKLGTEKYLSYFLNQLMYDQSFKKNNSSNMYSKTIDDIKKEITEETLGNK